MDHSRGMDPAPAPRPMFHWVRPLLIGKKFKWTALRILILSLATFAVFKWWVFLIRVDGDSMLPTYKDGEICIVNRLAYRDESPARGDVVVIGIAGRFQVVIKRIVGLPGEKVEWREGHILVNDAPLSEPYVKFHSLYWQRPPVLLRPEEYLFVGDNRSQERMQDHTHGEVMRERILGKVIR